MTHWQANGKLLLTGEYAVLDGAKALAVPTKMGQQLKLKPATTKPDKLIWLSYTNNGSKWLEAHIELSDFTKSNCIVGDQNLLDRLHQLLRAGQQLQPNLFDQIRGSTVAFLLDFPRNYGLGSSSTLLHLLGQWWTVDPFALLEKTFGGSGYDLACAGNDQPILYWKDETNTPKWESKSDWSPDWLNDTFFVHLNQKQNSRDGIRHYRAKSKSLADIKEVSELTHQLLSTNNLTAAREVLEAHEQHISKLIELPTAKARLFDDFDGTIKSLGAWGGDFVWVLPATDQQKAYEYFRLKGYKTIFPWQEMVK